jgi:hypothetical protein
MVSFGNIWSVFHFFSDPIVIENKFVNRKLEKKGGGKSVPRAPVVLTGTYKTQHVISRYEKSTTSSICRLCQKDTEDYVHFLLKCDTLSTIRYHHLVRLVLYLDKIQVNTDYLVNSEKDLLQLIIDCDASNLIDSQYRKDVDTICRDMIYVLHVKRAELLLE